MGLIKNKGNEPILSDNDKLLGTSEENDKTVNFPLLDVYEYMTITKGIPTSRFATTDIIGLNSANLASGDHLIFYDVTDSSLKKVDAATFLGIQASDISGLGTVTGASGDFVPILDASDGTVKKVDLSELLGGGAGDVTKVGTPQDDQVAVWTGDGTVEGNNDLKWNGTNLIINGGISTNGTVDGRDIANMNLLETDDLSIPVATNRYIDIPNDSSIIFRQGGLTDIITLDGNGVILANLDVEVPASAYSGVWNGSNAVPTKDAVYDKIESLQLSNLTDVGTTTPTSLNVLAADGTNWDSVALTASHIQSGTFADGRISQSSVTQHEAALSIVNANLTDNDVMAVKLARTNGTLGAGEDGYVAKYDNATGKITWAAESGGGASQLSDLSDVNTSTPTNRNVLVADGVDWESRALVEADISDLQTYALDADVVKLTGAQNIAGVKTFTSDVEISTNGSSFADPTRMTFVDFSTGEAARLGFGDDYNTIEAGFGRGMAMHCYNTIYLYGGRELLSALEADADYPNIADVAVQVAIEQGDKSFQVKTLDASPTAPLQIWTNSSDTDVASMSASGDLTVANEAYGVGWNGSLEVPTKDAVYDEMETKITASSTDTLTNKTLDFGNNTVQAVPFHYVYALSDEVSDLTTGTKLTIRAPHAMTVTDVRAHVTTAPTGSGITVDINESGTSILSTKLTIDATEKTSESAATAAVISDSAIADDAELTFDIDAVGSTTTGKGLKVAIIGTYNP